MESPQKCPKCKYGHLDSRTKRSLFIKLFLFWLPIRRYKCHKCGGKTYVFESDPAPSAVN